MPGKRRSERAGRAEPEGLLLVPRLFQERIGEVEAQRPERRCPDYAGADRGADAVGVSQAYPVEAGPFSALPAGQEQAEQSRRGHPRNSSSYRSPTKNQHRQRSPPSAQTPSAYTGTGRSTPPSYPSKVCRPSGSWSGEPRSRGPIPAGAKPRTRSGPWKNWSRMRRLPPPPLLFPKPAMCPPCTLIIPVRSPVIG